ncbi:MAG: asparagine synthase (glutamine-hydrolyzing) [candidate division NC10 bacterium]|nr:asparagine synthase (glutamine-hydrolyzing) [candidate division NC10 bacterium]
MCGISGKLFFDPTRAVEEVLIRRMCQVLAHRGPDGEGTYVNGPVGLGHRRLAIIDLSEAGRQPMTNEACAEQSRSHGTLWITFNGEIYNFPELREDLLKRGHRFRSKTDTEVILHLYEEKGVECLNDLRGMFAFAIWDEKRRRLFLARDRLGKKPLFYYADHEKFLFASEPKAILEDPDVKAEPDLEAIHHYLTYGYVPSPYSAFKGMKKLPPGHSLLLKDRDLEVRRYWKLSYTKKRPGARGQGPGVKSEEELCQKLLERLREAVRLRMVSDVPLGAFLSGGIDSSVIVALMSGLSSEPVKTFSIGFEEEDYNELPYARMVAKRFQTDHHEFIVKPDAVTVLPKLVWHYNEPFADSSAIPTYYLAKVTREHVTVALNGDAGDENFAGYDRYVANQLACRYDGLPLFLRRAMEKGAGLFLRSSRPGSLRNRARRFLEAIAEEPRRRYSRWLSHFNTQRKEELYTEAFKQEMEGLDSVSLLLEAYDASDAPDFIDATLDVDVQMYLPDDLLVKVDIASMAHSLEARSPLLDHRFMEFAASLPSELKLKGRTQKYIFKKALKELLPDEIIHRPKKGFGVPIDRWFRKDLREMAYDVLLDHRGLERGYFRREAVQKLLDEHCQGEGTWHYLLWNLLMLELWHRMFIDGGKGGFETRPYAAQNPCPS